MPHRVRRGSHFGNHFGPDYFGGEVVHNVSVANATSLEVIELTERCVDLLKQLIADYKTV